MMKTLKHCVMPTRSAPNSHLKIWPTMFCSKQEEDRAPLRPQPYSVVRQQSAHVTDMLLMTSSLLLCRHPRPPLPPLKQPTARTRPICLLRRACALNVYSHGLYPRTVPRLLQLAALNKAHHHHLPRVKWRYAPRYLSFLPSTTLPCKHSLQEPNQPRIRLLTALL